jgi:[acyl-carrier-protein] S-malonyltransferase
VWGCEWMERVAVLFPGQGSQYVGMGRTLYDQFEIAKRTFEEAGAILGFDVAKICFESTLGEISQIENAHLALLVSSVAAFRVYLQEIGVKPILAAGHSLGEYAALTCSGAIRFQDAVRLVYQRAKLIQEAASMGRGTMSVINGIDEGVLAALCKEVSTGDHGVAISCYNSTHEFNLSGILEAVQKVEDKVLQMGGQVTPLIGSAPIHSHFMAPVSEKLQVELAKYSYRKCLWPVISNLNGLFYDGPEIVVQNLADQIKKPVRWDLVMKTIEKYKITLTIELGAKSVLSNLVKTDQVRFNTVSFDHKEGRQLLADLFNNNLSYTKHIPTVITKCLAIAVATPNQNLDSAAYQQGVIEPYNRLKKIQAELEMNHTTPSTEQMCEALKILKQVLNTKKIPTVEQVEWFEEILIETGTYYGLIGNAVNSGII